MNESNNSVNQSDNKSFNQSILSIIHLLANQSDSFQFGPSIIFSQSVCQSVAHSVSE